MRTVKVRRLYGVGENSSPWEDIKLDTFIFMHPLIGFSLSCYMIIPPLPVFNDVFRSSECNAGMSGAIEWKPFEIDLEEYSELVGFLYKKPDLNLVFDEDLSRFETYSAWNRMALQRHKSKS